MSSTGEISYSKVCVILIFVLRWLCFRARVRQEMQSHVSQLHTIHTENETLRANNSQISTRMRDTQRDSERFKQELTSTQQMAENFQKEAQSLVADYQDAGRQIESLKEERDRYRGQAEMGVRELAQRGERIKALERERKVLEEQQQHMDLQVSRGMKVNPLTIYSVQYSLQDRE